nr:hypothetical protein [Tanacetum cinerariifolium]
QVITERGEEATTEVIPESSLEKKVAAMGPVVNKRRRKRGNERAGANTPPKVLRKDYAASRPAQSTRGEKSIIRCPMRNRNRTPSETLPTKSFRETATEVLTGHVATMEMQGAISSKSPESGKSTPFLSVDGSPEGIYQPGWGVTNNCLLDTPDACQDMVDHIVPPGYFSKLRHLPNADCLSYYNMNLARQVAMGSQLRLRFEQEVRLLKKATAKIAKRDQRIKAKEKEIKKMDHKIKSFRTVETEVHGLRNQAKNLNTLLEAEVDMKKAAEAKNAGLAKELESLRAQFADLQVSNNQLSQQVSTLRAQFMGEERIKAAFEEFKKYEDDRVNSWSPMGYRHGLRPVVMKCAESTEQRHVFADVVFVGFAKGMSEGLKHGIEHGKANLDLAAIEAYDPEADAKYVVALHALKDLKYPLIDLLEKLKDSPIDLIMASLYLESDSGEDAPQWIHELRLNSSQLKFPVYPEVRGLKDPWSFKEEILLEDAIADNISRAEKKKKCQVVCHTRGVGSAHHARSDGVPVSVPTVAPQGLAILLADDATQTEISE